MPYLPDLGIYLVQNQLNQPFVLQAYDGLLLAKDGVLGWMINGTTQNSRVSSIKSNPIPIIKEPCMFSIYLGEISQLKAKKVLKRFKFNGLAVVVREDKKYLVPNGKEWVVPLKYLSKLTKTEVSLVPDFILGS